MKKGAMFGLDARIALAIFGALSVISGAALYSAIQEAKVTAELTKFRELEKALEAYYLDTGQLPTNGGLSTLDTSELLENTKNLANWNGPYIAYDKSSARFMDDAGINTVVAFGSSADWGAENTDTISRVTCASLGVSDTCALYIARQWIDRSISFIIKERIDNNTTINQGNVRLWCKTTSYPNSCTIYKKIDIPAPL